MSQPTPAGQAAASALQSASEKPTHSPDSPTPEPLSEFSVRALWARMTDIYGHRWVSTHGADAATGSGDTWAKGMAGVSVTQLAVGLKACVTRADAWPPTIGEFRALCLGIPSLGEVIAELANTNAERSPFATAVWRRLDDWAYRRADARKADAMMAEAYDHVRKRLLLGDALPKPEPQVEHKPKPFMPAQPHVVDRAFAEIMQALGIGRAP